jgi:hypothetical protein
MGVDKDAKLFFGWLLSGSVVCDWLQRNQLLYEGPPDYLYTEANEPPPAEVRELFPKGVALDAASPWFDAEQEARVFAVTLLPTGRSPSFDFGVIAAIAADKELVEAGRHAVLAIDPENSSARAAPRLHALPHIW